MQTSRIPFHLNQPHKAFLLFGACLVLCGVFPQAAQAATVHSLHSTYEEWAIVNEWAKIEDGKVQYEPGFRPTEDKDGDGLSNREEFDGWQTTINGRTGWFTHNLNRVSGLADPAFFGYGPDPVQFDTDCDGISDLYEFYARTNPHSQDTDADGLKDPVELYAGLDPCDDGFVYDLEDDGVTDSFSYSTSYDGKVTIDGVKMADPVITNLFVMTLQHPLMDIDGDGLTSKQELKKANDIDFSDGCPEPGQTRAHFPWEQLDAANWTSPFDCDTDNDWMLDSFEKAFAKNGFNATVAEPRGDPFHYDSDPEKDGLTNFREQAMHPLLAYSWGPHPVAVWPFVSSGCPEEQKINGRIKVRFKEPSRGGCLNATVGYLSQAQYNKFGDQARYFTATYNADGTPDQVERKGIPGNVRWPSAIKTYWTEPRPAIIYHGWDTDMDGLPDGWEVEHGLNPLSGWALLIVDSAEDDDDEDSLVAVDAFLNPGGIDPSTGLGDPDGDNLTNLQEYYGADGYRIDFITGTGDETIPWIGRALNAQTRSSFEAYLKDNLYLIREPMQSPMGFDLISGFSTVYATNVYPGFFNPLALSREVTNWVVNLDPMVPDPIVEEIGAMKYPTPGVPPVPTIHDMMELAEFYGPAFVPTFGAGGFQPFTVSFAGFTYLEPAGQEDGRYTPGVDTLWFASIFPGFYMPPDPMAIPPFAGDLILDDPDNLLAGVIDPVEGLPVTDNQPLMVPMPGTDTDSDGLPDSMELRMDVARGKMRTSPVQSLSPLISRSAKIVDDAGMKTLFVDDPRYFSRSFTVEAWVYLDGADPAGGSFIKGYLQVGPTDQRKAYDLGVTNVVINGQVVSTVPYAGLHTLDGFWYQVSATRPLPRNRWVHLAATFDNKKNALSLYIDGTLTQSREVGEETIGKYLLENTASGGELAFAVGTGFANRLWLDECRIWGIERSREEVAQTRFNILEGRQAIRLDGRDLNGSLLAYYNFDDGGDVAVCGRHRALSSLRGFDYPGANTVANRSHNEYLYPDRAYALPTTKFGGGFVFDAGRTAPVEGALDSQRGELDSDGDGLPDAWEIVHELNPFAWLTPEHTTSRYDPGWGDVAGAEVLIRREGATFHSSADAGMTWVSATCPLVTSVVNGQLVTTLCPNTVLIGSYTTTTNFNDEGEAEVETVPEWEIMSGQIISFIEDGQTWWVSRSGVAVAQVSATGKMMSDADGDPDGDGLTNLQEYWARTNPRKFDTDENGIPDGDEDFDGDGLTNLQEARIGSRPDLVDTDDNGMSDADEYAANSVPVDSKSPRQNVAAYFTGKPGNWLEIQDRNAFVQASWTVEAKVLPARVNFLADGEGAPIFRRGVEAVSNGMLLANYELRVVRDGANLYPEARFVYKNVVLKGIGVPIAVRGSDPLPVSATYDPALVVHLAATYSGSGNRLSLYVNGVRVGTRQDPNISAPQTGEGPTSIVRIGERFHGFVDDLRLWSTPRSEWEISSSMNQTLDGQESGLAAYYNFNDGGWPVLSTNAWNTARITNLLYSVNYLAPPVLTSRRDGDTWMDGLQVYVNESGVARPVSGTGPVFSGSGVVPGTGFAQNGDFGWNHAEGLLYRYNGTTWQRWGQGRYWLADARAIIKAKIDVLDDMLMHDPTRGDLFVCPADQVVYIYNGVTPDGSVVELTADPLLDGHRFYLYPEESIVEWRAALNQLVTVATAADEDNLFIRIQSEGMAYKSEDKVFRRWGYVPSTEDYTIDRGWETGWAEAAKMSGVVEFFAIDPPQMGYVPTGGRDTDGDGLPDSWEIRYGLNHLDGGFGGTSGGTGIDYTGDGRADYIYNPADFVNGAWGDPDNDGLNNRAEWLAGTNPFEYDTHGDGRSDFDSPETGPSYGSLYMDGDNIPDGWESLFPTALSPLRFDAHLDPDGDGWDNYSEYMGVFLSHTASEYVVTTNTDGTVSTNITSGKGYRIPYCLPDDAASYPKPQLTFRFKTDCPEAEGTLRIWAYTDPEMNCPDAMTSLVLDAPIRDGNTLAITDWMDGGHLRQGANYFLAFVDQNNNGQWDQGEPMGFSEYMPENISWGEAVIDIALREHANGFFRAAWPAVGGEGGGGANDTYTVRVSRNTTVVYSATRGGCSATRRYLHEFDFRNAAGTFSGISTGAMYGTYTWTVRDQNNVLITSGTNTVDYPTTLTAPAVQNPMGTIFYAKEKLRMTLDPNATQIQIQIQRMPGGATVLNTTRFAPYVNRQGVAEMDLPILAGYGSFTNGQYRIQVRAYNPRATASSAWVNFTVDLKAPASGGPGMITGRANYFGWASGANIVVEAFKGSGFDQRPAARVKADASLNYRLMGLPLGTYHVRAFHDHNNNGVLDGGEAWGLVKGAPATLTSINWVPSQIRKLGGVSTAPAVSIYATDYSVKSIEVRSTATYADNDLVVHDADSDNDGLPDAWEYYYAGNLTSMNQHTDTNSDGLLDIEKFRRGLHPLSNDTDGDGLTDKWEVDNGLDPLSAVGANGAVGDPDGDGLTNEQEQSNGTNPLLADTDGDGLSDGDEVLIHGTDPLNPDTDGDGLPDGWEVTYNLNPHSAVGIHGASGDPDGDLLTNEQELALGTNPRVADTDGDGLSDYDEVHVYGTNPVLADSDGDGLSDGDEVLIHGTDPLNPDTDGDGMGDGFEIDHGFDPLDPADAGLDADGDGLTNLQEFRWGTNPLNIDTDGDGLDDHFEVTYNYGLLNGDPDDYRPYPGGGDLNANDPDTDGDGYPDGEEYDNMGIGYDPLDPSKPMLAIPPSFTSRPEESGGTDLRLIYEVLGTMPKDVVVESTADLESGTWSNEFQANITKSGGYTNVVPSNSGSDVKFYRIRFLP